MWAFLLSIGVFVLAPILVIAVARLTGGTVNTPECVWELAKQAIVLRLLLALRAGVTEELLFRAYPTERMGGRADKAWVGAIAGLAVFTLLHAPGWGWGLSLGVVLPIGAVFAWLYARKLSVSNCEFRVGVGGPRHWSSGFQLPFALSSR